MCKKYWMMQELLKDNKYTQHINGEVSADIKTRVKVNLMYLFITCVTMIKLYSIIPLIYFHNKLP